MCELQGSEVYSDYREDVDLQHRPCPISQRRTLVHGVSGRSQSFLVQLLGSLTVVTGSQGDGAKARSKEGEELHRDGFE